MTREAQTGLPGRARDHPREPAVRRRHVAHRAGGEPSSGHHGATTGAGDETSCRAAGERRVRGREHTPGGRVGVPVRRLSRPCRIPPMRAWRHRDRGRAGRAPGLCRRTVPCSIFRDSTCSHQKPKVTCCTQEVGGTAGAARSARRVAASLRGGSSGRRAGPSSSAPTPAAALPARTCAARSCSTGRKGTACVATTWTPSSVRRLSTRYSSRRRAPAASTSMAPCVRSPTAPAGSSPARTPGNPTRRRGSA